MLIKSDGPIIENLKVAKPTLLFSKVAAFCDNQFIGRLRKSGGQKIDLISLLLNKFS